MSKDCVEYLFLGHRLLQDMYEKLSQPQDNSETTSDSVRYLSSILFYIFLLKHQTYAFMFFLVVGFAWMFISVTDHSFILKFYLTICWTIRFFYRLETFSRAIQYIFGLLERYSSKCPWKVFKTTIEYVFNKI